MRQREMGVTRDGAVSFEEAVVSVIYLYPVPRTSCLPIVDTTAYDTVHERGGILACTHLLQLQVGADRSTQSGDDARCLTMLLSNC